MGLPAIKLNLFGKERRISPSHHIPAQRPNHLHLVHSTNNPAVPSTPTKTRHPLLQRIVTVAQRSWLSIPTFRRSTPLPGGPGPIGSAGGAAPVGAPPGGQPPLQPPKRPTDEGPQLAFPKRSAFFKMVPHFAGLALLGYVILRAFTLTTIPWVSAVAAIALFLAELHCITNGLQYQNDLKNEKRYDQWKLDNWPSEQQINHTISPEGPRTAMEIASAAEEPSTVWPTVYGTIEMEGNKQVIMNTQGVQEPILWIKLKKVKDKSLKGYQDFFAEFQKSPGPRMLSEFETLASKYNLARYAATFQNIRTQLATVPNLALQGLEALHKSINEQLQNIAFLEKQRLVESVNAEYGTLWHWIMGQVQGRASGAAPVDASRWIVPNETERQDRVTTLGGWKSLSPKQKIEILSNTYRMLGRRHITRGGLWTYWGSEKENLPGDAEFESLLRKVFFGSLRTSGEVEEVGLGKEVDIAPYGYVDATGTLHSFSTNMDKLVEKVKEYMNNQGATSQERLLYAFDYMRDLIGMDKREQAAAGELEYFPRNVRSGGEDIKTGLEYETLAEECQYWEEAHLDFQFERIVNTYTNHKVTWWDRDRLADLDHGGRKSNSINSLVHHLAGKWRKTVKRGEDPRAKNTSGYIVAADTYSALMRVFLERLENGQYVWDTLRERINRDDLNSLNPEQVITLIEQELQGIEQDHSLKAKRWVFINAFLEQLTTAGDFSEANLTQTLQAESMLPNTISPSLRKQIKRATAWLKREKSIEGQRRILHYFFDQAGEHLRLEPRGNFLKMMVDLAFKDKEIPADHVIVEEYNFDDIKYFTNIDAEVRPRPDFMARTIPLLDKLIEEGEVPPRMTLIDKILWKLFKRQPGGSIKAGFLQCPQFYTIDPETGEPLHFTAHIDQRLFYQVIQPSKSLNDGTFSCGSNVIYHLSSKRETSERLFTEPGANSTQELGKLGKKAAQPGGWSYKYTASEIYVEDRDGNLRPVVAYQTAESPTEDHASTIHFLDYEVDKKPERKKGVYLNDIIGKGEAPKDLNNLLGKQHPKWAGGTIGDFFYIILPRYLRWLPGTSFMAQQMLKIVNAIPAPIRAGGKALVKVGDEAFFRIPVLRHLWRFTKIISKLGDHLIWETAMSHKPKMNPFSKIGLEFFRSGTWYMRGIRDLILIAAPVLLTTSILGSALAAVIFTGIFTPILINPWAFGAFFLAYLTTTLTAYLYSTKRLGQRVRDVLFKKEAVLLGQGWPGYVHADFVGLMGPSGRLGATTTKGVGGREHLTARYALPSLLAGVASLAGAGIGVWLLSNTIYFLGAAVAFSGPGVGIALCTFWALYHAGMIFRGFGISQSLNSTLGQKYIDWAAKRSKALEDFLLTCRGIGFTFKKTLFGEPLDSFYAPKTLKNLFPIKALDLDELIVPKTMKANVTGWRRINPLIILGKLFYGLLGWFRRPEKW